METYRFPAAGRWTGLVFVLLGIGLVLAKPAAANTIFVSKTDTTCGGLGTTGVTCFATIQDGVNHAVAPAQVNVFPATYAESVNIGTMATPGDLTLIVRGPGTVTVAPPTGPALFNAGTFPGSLTVTGFTLHSVDDNGLFVAAGGNANFTNVVANGNKGAGLVFDALQVALISCTANNNGGRGFDFFADGYVTVESSTANGNKGLGFIFQNVHGDVRIDSSTANTNSSVGFSVKSDEAVMVRDSTANGNDSGFTIIANGAVTIDPSSANGNLFNGIFIHGSDAVTIRRVSVQNNGEDGIDLEEVNSATISCSDIAGNALFGLKVDNAITVMAEHNWWGSVTGPTAAGNPGGTGDKIDPDGGTVNFIPFLFAPAEIASPCTSRAPAPALSATGLAGTALLLLGSGVWLTRRRQRRTFG